MTKTRESAILEIAYAILTTLNTNAHLVDAHGCSSYDYVPEGTPEPYIHLDNPTEAPWDCLNDEYGERVTYILHIWSVYRGAKECADIIAHIKELLDNQDLSITGYDHIRTRVDFSNVIRDMDMLHYHGIVSLSLNVVQQ
jgi:hypothetical protein